MSGSVPRPTHPADWRHISIEPGKYCNTETLTGLQRRDGQSGNPLHPALDDDRFESDLAARLQVLEDACPGVIAERHHVVMPNWRGPQLPVPAGNLTLNLLNRVAAGSRNGPGADADGLKLSATALVRLQPSGSEPIQASP